MSDKELLQLTREYLILTETLKMVLSTQEALVEKVNKIEKRLDILIGSTQEAKKNGGEDE